MMPDLFFPSNDPCAVRAYAQLIDKKLGALAAWQFLQEKGYSPQEIIDMLKEDSTADCQG